MNKTNFRTYSLLIIGVCILFASSCKKANDNEPALNSPNSPNNPTNGKTTAVFNSSVTYSTMTDQDGNIYKTVTIGTQTWIAENLRTTKYNDGTAISNVIGATEWANLKTGAYCNYNNTTNTDNIATYGRLYNWYAVNTGKLAPKGWHVPTDAEWTQLTDYLGETGVVGGKLKETGTSLWSSPNTKATNESGFTALPGGWRGIEGSYCLVGIQASWWSSTELQTCTDCVWDRSMFYDLPIVSRNGNSGKKMAGFSVRCVKD